MATRSIHRVLLATFSLLLTQQVWGTIVPLLDVPSLTHEADVIVVGTVVSVHELEKGNFKIREQVMPAQRKLAWLRVDRVIKGESSRELSFEFLAPEVEVGYAGAFEGQFGLFFLRSSEGGLTVASPFNPRLVAAPDSCETSGSELARVVGELGCVLQSPVTSVAERVHALQALGSVRGGEASKILKRSIRELDPPLRTLAASIAVSLNDIAGLPLVEEALHESPLLVVEGEHFSMEANLGSCLYGLKDPAAIPALARVMHSRDSGTRRGAIQAIRNTGSQAAIEALAMALYDPDWDVRWVAVMGLAEILHEDAWCPAYDGFKAREQFYLDHWRDWERNRR